MATPPDGMFCNSAEKLLGLADDFDALLFEFGFFADEDFVGDGVNNPPPADCHPSFISKSPLEFFRAS